jgi:hypothetical protein
MQEIQFKDEDRNSGPMVLPRSPVMEFVGLEKKVRDFCDPRNSNI